MTKSFFEIAVACLPFLLAAHASAQQTELAGISDHNIATFITFDPPGSIYVGAPSINNAGAVTGPFWDANQVVHGYLRAADGTITTFDAPGAGALINSGTFPMGINSDGVVAGYFTDANYVAHGFARADDGTITTFDAPGAGTSYPTGTFATSINTSGAITGHYYAEGLAGSEGFIRTAKGVLATFSISSGTPDLGQAIPYSLNDSGVIAGIFVDANRYYHGFVRAVDGAITVFDPPGTIAESYGGTFVQSINAAGMIVGFYSAAGGCTQGFVRDANGVITPVVVAGAVCTDAMSINRAGTIAGWYTNGTADGYTSRGFVRAANGAFTTFIAPGTPHLSFNTHPTSINRGGAITGYYGNQGGFHSFVLTP